MACSGIVKDSDSYNGGDKGGHIVPQDASHAHVPEPGGHAKAAGYCRPGVYNSVAVAGPDIMPHQWQAAHGTAAGVVFLCDMSTRGSIGHMDALKLVLTQLLFQRRLLLPGRSNAE